MPPKQSGPRKSILVVPNRVVGKDDGAATGGEETEIAARIHIPQDGGWGWMVVFASFTSIFLMDGIVYTFGSILPDMVHDMESSNALIALVNSITVSLYLTCGPIVSAFINRFGFRACCMTGSVIASISLYLTYHATSFAMICVFYGMFTGIGCSLINMSSSLVVGFYFEKLRSLALAICTCGSSMGVTTFFPLNSFLVNRGGWRNTILLHSGLMGIIFFLGMAFRPLVSLTVTQTTDNEPTRTTTYLPSIVSVVDKTQGSNVDVMTSSKVERMLKAVSNTNFPTAAEMVDDGTATAGNTEPGPSTAPGTVSKLTLTAHKPEGGFSSRHIKQLKAIASKTNQQENVEVTIDEPQSRKKLCWLLRICHWESRVQEARPLYRDDAFYEGEVKNLPEYQKSMLDATSEGKTGLEYQLAVSRTIAASDLRERRGVFTTAARRVLATMMDPKLLKRKSFLCICTSGALVYMGYLVPYVFIKDRNEKAGVGTQHCGTFVSVIGISNAVGRLSLGSLAVKLDPLKLFSFSCFVSGLSTTLSMMSFNVYYQYAYCIVFGFFIAGIACLRSIVLVQLYGLEKLTNATGIILLFQGIGSLFGTPLAGAITKTCGYTISFVIAGIFIATGGLILIPIKYLSAREIKKENRKSVGT